MIIIPEQDKNACFGYLFSQNFVVIFVLEYFYRLFPLLQPITVLCKFWFTNF